MSAGGVPAAALGELLDAIPDGILVTGRDGRIQYLNKAVEELFGYDRGELVGATVERLVPTRLGERHAGHRRGYGEHPEPRPMGLGLHLQGRRKDGREVPVEISLAPMSGGRARSVVAIVRDAAEQQRRVEERLRYARAHAVEEIVGALDAIVWESTTADRAALTYLGGREEVLLGYSRSQWHTPGFWMSVVHPEDRPAVLSLAAGGDQEHVELRYRMTAADGTSRRVRDIVTLSRDGAGHVRRLRGVVTDVTERQEIVDRATQAQKLEAVGQLAGGIAHDFNNLLTIVSGYARRLKGRAQARSDQSDLDQILMAAERASQLTRQLLTFARRGHGSAKLIDLSALVRELEPMLRRLLAADIAFDFRLQDGLPQVLMDRTAAEQIMMNLMLNASDAMPAGGTLRVTTAARTIGAEEAARRGHDPGGYVELSVADTGTGIAPEVLERIFEPFFSTKGDRGTGMGLATVYGTVDEAGGRIGVESAVGAGTTFTVMLPATPTAAESPGEVAGAATTVLLVEDEPALRRLVVTVLEEEGYAVLQAPNGLDAIALAERHAGRIDLLVTDVVMPRLSGPELAERLRALRPGLEVLFMSGYNDSRLLARGVQEGKVNLLVKPFAVDRLVEEVAALTAAEPAGEP